MINLEELKPILEPLLTEENSADVISQIQAIDRSVEDTSEEIKKQLNAEWNEKFKKAFLENAGVPETKSSNPDEPSSADPNTSDIEEPSKPKTFDDLFTTNKEE